ncbi:MAG: nucleotidyltransferase family protein [Proteobacteria bacterium]|nr:nucleotidyltransferase family protein [Pseudomonadota bacterium]
MALVVRSEDLHRRFTEDVLRNPFNREILARLPRLGLDQAYLVAGCLVQTIWNEVSGRPATADIKDYDVFYFDDRDLSWEAEDGAIRRAAGLFADLGVTVELRNQARVHLWFERRFGVPYPRLTSTKDGIDRFLTPCTCVGIRPVAAEGHEVYAPYGLDELYAGLLRPNPANDQPRLFEAKAASYRARWPWLTITAA